ncbi:MAG: sigma-70 family RNA polymerase sigma factor [bacterium]
MNKKSKNSQKATLVIYDIFWESVIDDSINSKVNLKDLVNDFDTQKDKTKKDKILCQKIIPYFSKFINKLTNKYKTFNKEDIIQIAHLAIIKALKNYHETDKDPTSYFICYIEKEVKNYIMNQDIVKIPKTIRKIFYQIQKYLYLHPEATVKQLSEKFNLTEEAINEILSLPTKKEIDLNLIKSKQIKDLELPIEDKIFLEQILKNLSEVEKKVINFILYEDLTKINIAQKLNISRKHLYTIFNKIKEKIFKNM